MSRWLRYGTNLLAVPLILAGVTFAYVKYELAEPESFADRAVQALRSDAARAVIAEEIVVDVLERGSPDLVASRPLVLAAIEAILDTEEFGRLMRRAAVTAHRTLLEGEGDAIVELEQAGEVLLPVIESAAPEIAGRVPTEFSPRIAELRESDAATTIVRISDGADAAALPILALALLALLTPIAAARDRQAALIRSGVTIVAAGATGLLAMTALRAQAVLGVEQIGVLSAGDARAGAGAGWDALAGGLEDWLSYIAVAGVALTAAGVLAKARVDRREALRYVGAAIAGGQLPRAVHVARGLALVVVGALVLLRAEPVFLAAVLGLGGVLVLLGLTEALSTLRAADDEPRAQLGRPAKAALIIGSLAAIGAVSLLLVTSDDSISPPDREELVACNGMAALCERRLDEVAFAGTHNSMAAADRPGWFFANQVRPIPRQLADGIRFLMIDPHYGIADSSGRVRTDLAAEGTNRNRIARRLGAEAIEATERLVGRLGLVPTEGDREIYLCHTLCELGAEEMSDTLDELRAFLEQNPSEVIVVFIESSVDPVEVEEQFERADLEPYLAELEREGPLPRLGEMVTSGRRLVVLDQGDGGDEPWYHPGFVFMRDATVKTLPVDPTECVLDRGVPESSLLLMNHWIDRFPPPPSANRAIGDRETILRRARSCRRAAGQHPNLIAVDFYERTDVVDAVRELNRDDLLKAPR